MEEERGELKTDADGNVNVDELEYYNPMKHEAHKNAKIAPSTFKEIEERGLWKPFNDRTSQLEKGGRIKKYELGDMWNPNFNYNGMLKMGMNARVSWGVEKLQSLSDSFEDVNYHTENIKLIEAIDYLRNGDELKARQALGTFNLYCRSALGQQAFGEGKDEYAKGGEIGFDNSNLYLNGFGMDSNGNSVVKVSFPNQRAFSIQTNGVLKETNSLYTKNIKELTEAQIKTIEKEVVDYVKQFGSKEQKQRLKTYSGYMAKGGEFKPYGKTKGKYKIEYTEDGEKQSEVWESKEMVEDRGKRLLKLGHTNIKITELKQMAKGGSVDFDYELKIQPDFKYKNIAKGWLEDNAKDSTKYKLAVLLLRGKRNPDEILGINEVDRYARLLRSLESAKGGSKHETEWRTENYTLNDAQKWTIESLGDMFYIHANTTKMAKGGEITREDITILGVPRSKITDKEWESIIRMSKYQKGATFILKDEKGLDVKPQIEYDWYVNEKMADGGKVKFADKVKSVQESLLKRKKVSPKVQKDYGKTYSKAEAKESAQRIVGSRMAQLKEKMAKKKK
jgi:hypothetical protein